jgi:hypothetical protein
VEVEAFELTDSQAAGLRELIRDVEGSELEEQFRIPMAEALRQLLDRLMLTKTKPDMQAALAETMAVLLDITYDSSTATEMLNALWDTGDVYMRYLAKALDTGKSNVAEWGDFADSMNEYVAILMGDTEEKEGALVGVPRLKGAIDGMVLKLDMALTASGLPKEDSMYDAVSNIFNNNVVGLRVLLKKLDRMNEETARAELESCFNITAEKTFAAISKNKANASVGEYAMTRLSAIFGVPVPEFERPEFFKKNLLVDGSQGPGEDDDKKPTGDGSIGDGAVVGSDDYVLDYKTGELKKLIELIDEYTAIMYERLNGDYYTEEQKEAIQKYINLLYSGIEKDEDK